MREVTDHVVPGDSLNHQLKIIVCDEPVYGANHRYVIGNHEQGPLLEVDFQNGPVAERGINGISNEALIAIVLDRLNGFQSGEFASPDNARAIVHLKLALVDLQNRTRDRLARGVEGTRQK